MALSELNCPELHSELNDEFTTVDGGYQEPSYYKRFALWWNRDQTLDEPEENLRTLGEINDEGAVHSWLGEHGGSSWEPLRTIVPSATGNGGGSSPGKWIVTTDRRVP